MTKSVYIFTWHDLSSAYSCLLYLKQRLTKTTNVTLWSKTDLTKLSRDKRMNHLSFTNKWYGKMRKIRYILACFDVFFICITQKNILAIVNDWDFYIPVYFAKKINKSMKVVHYNTEISGEDVKINPFIEKFYTNHANFPDIIIECLKQRADWRKKKYKIKKDIYVINNTLPLEEVEDMDTSSYPLVIDNIRNLPVLVYAGRASLSRQLGDIIDCIPKFANEIYFLFFCYGSDDELSVLKKTFQDKCKSNNYHINDAINRKELLKVMTQCNIGVNYYIPDFSINHKYASPTKFFEYMACGLNIVSTNNEGINNIINEEGIGECIGDNENLSDALHRLLKSGLKNRDEIKSLFAQKYCYEIDSKKAIEQIEKLIHT